MFGQGASCTYQICRGAVITAWKTEAKVVREKSEMSLEMHVTFFPQVTKLEDNASTESLQTLVIDKVKQFSNAEEPKGFLRSWVAENWPTDIGANFARGIPITVLSLIAHGINEFAARQRKSTEPHDDQRRDKIGQIKG
jgi:hypothetical protein